MRSAAWSTDARQNELERVCARGVKDELNLLLSETRTLHDTVHGSASDQDLSESGGRGFCGWIKIPQPPDGGRTPPPRLGTGHCRCGPPCPQPTLSTVCSLHRYNHL